LALPFGLLIWYHHNMAKAITVIPRKRGRPSKGGRDPLISLRLPQEMIAGLERWAVANGVSRSEAVRDLISERLSAPKAKSKR
jgi:hypothetical protein